LGRRYHQVTSRQYEKVVGNRLTAAVVYNKQYCL
jgi:hypothetical protein